MSDLPTNPNASLTPLAQKIRTQATTRILTASQLPTRPQPTCENLNALARVLSSFDIDVTIANSNTLQEDLNGSREAKMKVLELLFEESKRRNRRELVSLLWAVDFLVVNLRKELLGLGMGMGFWGGGGEGRG
jgi:hypothetical protein